MRIGYRIVGVSVPRTRGGDPELRLEAQAINKRLFPAHAGVIHSVCAPANSLATVPRTRGGDPFSLPPIHCGDYCSPHTRG